jgi:hypothetical protein
MKSEDKDKNLVGLGNLDNIRMLERGKFNEMTVLLSNAVNGQNSDYTIEFKATIPVLKDDIFYFELPPTIRSPKTP